MTIAIPKENKEKVLDLIEALLQETMYRYIRPENVPKVQEHFAHLRQNPETMYLKTQLHTDDKLQITKVTFEMAFTPMEVPKQ